MSEEKIVASLQELPEEEGQASLVAEKSTLSIDC
jgi:hypothetical protein